MKHIIVTCLGLISILNVSYGAVYILEGVYQGKDIYVQNPFATEGVGFCVFEVQVNGQITSDEINSSAFSVDLGMFEFMLGDDVVITIRSKSDCSPKIINPDAISPVSTCEIKEVVLNLNGKLSWKTTNENGKLPFIIEHYKWNKWVQIGSVLGEGIADECEYNLAINLPGGENKIRIKQKDYNGEHITEELFVISDNPKVELKSSKVTDYIEFTGKTHYEIFNSYGEVVKSGYNSRLKVTDFDKGLYYLNFEKELGVEIKKR